VSRQYKNPPIEEALCEFTFTPTIEWNLTLPGKLHIEIQDEYAGPPRQQNIQTIVTGPQAAQPSIAFQNELLRIQLLSTDGTRLVSIGKNTLSVSVLRPYEGWLLFKPRIERALSAYRKVAAPQDVIRVGLRYINRIVVPTANSDPSSYFNYNLSRDDVLDAGISNFMKRFEYLKQGGEKLIITHATLQPSDSEKSEFILDIDTIWDREPLNFDQVLETTEKLHTIEGSAFEAIITDEARRLFDA
jgi:uncharacterized protein (TIGR04255 family)